MKPQQISDDIFKRHLPNNNCLIFLVLLNASDLFHVSADAMLELWHGND